MKVSYTELYENTDRIDRLTAMFGEHFGAGDVEYFSAPGRTEVGGNHTDHNHGRVLAAAVNLDVLAAARKTDDNIIHLKSEGFKEDIVDLSDLTAQENEREHSASLIRGVCARCAQLGYKIGSFEAYTTSNVLKGSGLSSSAAFEVLVVTIISHLYNGGEIDPVTAAIVSKFAENEYFGKPSGLMDQMASSVGGFTSIDFADTDKPIIERVDFDLRKSGHALCIVDTKGNHADLTGEYASIPAEMKQVAACFGKEYLREVDEAEFMSAIPKIRKQTGDRAVLRAMHFYEDDHRAKAEADALRAGDFEEFKRLINESGISSETKLKNVFATINPREQGLSLALALTRRFLGEQGACRVHGGGFAGTIQAFVPLNMLADYKQTIEAVFGVGSCYVLNIRAEGGTKVTVFGDTTAICL